MKNILIIDDEESVRSALKRFLSRHDFTVFEAAQGEEGLNILKNEKIDLIILDLQMPVKGGIETLLQLRRETSEHKVILISGKVPSDSQSISSLAKQFGVEHILFKPFSNKELLSYINNLSSSSVH